MGMEHVRSLGKRLQAEARGRFYVEEVLYTYTTKNDKHIRGVAEDASTRRYQMRDRKTGRDLAELRIESLPGCCGVLLLHSFSGAPKEVQTFIELACRAGQQTGYGQVMLTFRSESPIIDLLQGTTRPWTATTFLNGKTNHDVAILMKTLQQERQVTKVSATASE